MSKGDFWKWYWSLIRFKDATINPRLLLLPVSEWVFGWVFIIATSIVIPIYASPYCLFLTVPLGVTVIAHAWWREWERQP